MQIAEPTPSLDSALDTRTGFPIGAKVGIALAAVLVLLTGSGCFIIYNGKRRRRAYLQRVENQKSHNMPAFTFTYANGNPRAAPSPVVTSWPASQSPSSSSTAAAAAASTGGLGFGLTPSPSHHNYDGRSYSTSSETPLSRRPLRGGWDDSPLSASTDRSDGMTAQPFVRYWSPYGSPVSPEDGRAAHFAQSSATGTPVQPREIGLAFGDDGDAKSPAGAGAGAASGKKGKDKEAAEEEAYEMYKLGQHHPEMPLSGIPPPPPPPPPPAARDHRRPSHGETTRGHDPYQYDERDDRHQTRYTD